jgi:tetratricopeptide (TPR) repeat protein
MKRERSRKPQRPPVAKRSPDSSAVRRPPLSPGRKWLLRLLAVFVPPLVILGGLEMALRLVGYGFDPQFFKRATIGGKDYYMANDDFGRRFFPRSLARIPPPAVMPVTKEPGTFRIFIFGESAALGDPRPNYGAGCYLEALLAKRFPQAKFEIINTSMTAINSHAILPIARECTRQAGDLWLIYMGNNEMVGPFGAATVFGVRAPPMWLVRAQLQLRRLRLGQLLLQASEKLPKGKPAASGWHGMEMFVENQVAPNDPRKQRVYRNLERNLDDILQAGRDSGAKLILSTVAVNLKDCPPFGSLSGAELPGPNRAEFEKLCQEGAATEAQGHLADAQREFQRATEICPAAEAHFQLATCLLRQTNSTSARTHFLQAMDADTLPFRADSRINESIRAAARRFGGESFALCDAAEALKAASPTGIPGEESFYEHVHLNPHGNYALALAWAGQVERLLSPALKQGARPSWASQAECDQRLGLTDWNRVSILEDILLRVERPPFSGQSGSAERSARLRGEVDGLRQHLTREAAADAREVYLRALRRAPEDFRLHENYAEFLEATHELKPAVAERRKVCELLPHYYFPHYSLGLTLKEAGELAEARQALLEAAALKPDQGEVQLELGIVCARQGEWEPAREYLEGARRLVPEDPRGALYLGEVLWKLERRGNALAALREAIRLAPLDWQPHYRLASDLAQQAQFSEAAAEYQAALHLNPGNVKTKLGLAAVLVNLGRQPEALAQTDEVLKLEPDNAAALEFQRKVRGGGTR